MTIRHATGNDLPAICDIYCYARRQMALAGNPKQWGDDRPSLETIREDIRQKQSYVISGSGHICGVFALITGADATYQMIEDGAWLNENPYGTIHRIAGNGRTCGIFAAALSFCEDQLETIGIKDIRIDTHEDNRIMQHLLDKYGFAKCGCIYVEDRTPRIAYQKERD